MKFVKRISLFLATAGIMFSAGSYATLKAEKFFYPNKYEKQRENAVSSGKSSSGAGNGNVSGEKAVQTEKEAGELTEKKQVIETAMEKPPVITADTIYLVEEVNLSDGTVTERQEEVPQKYIGLDRTNLIEELAAYDRNPPLSDLRLGFQTIELASFSRERVVICKYYRSEEEDKGYYLMVADHYVIVYEEDKRTIHTSTDILMESLSEELQEEIINGKYMENEQELYNFLESYSS